jgi:LuxR family maltose regulon positive regulatory protein
LVELKIRNVVYYVNCFASSRLTENDPAMPPNLIQTKLLVPPLRPGWVKRPHLVAQMNSGLERKLILVSAPAGYGKSTLLAEWVHQASLPVAWLTLESGDNTPSRFWPYFISALRSLPVKKNQFTGESLMGLEGILPQPAPEEALAGLVEELIRYPEPFALVLDDLHLVTDPGIHSGLVFLLEHLPASPQGMRLVIAGRQDPPWPLARMRARAQVAELRTRDLRFTAEETSAFLNQSMGLGLSAADVARLDQRTEGWIAGLQMAALSMQTQDDIPAFLERFSGSHRYILDYLTEDVLNQQPPKVIAFLLKTSILDKLSAPLCDAVTGNKDSQEMLVRLEHSNVFVTAVDDEQRWYRYHHLFGDLLRKHLMTGHAAEIPALHSRASAWYEAGGFLREAILHALEAGDMKQVARLVSGNILILAEGEALPELLQRFHSTRQEDICSRPWLCIAIAWAKAYAGQMDEAEMLVDQMESSLAGKVTEDERANLIGHGLTVRAYVQWLKGRFEKAVDISREALTKIPDEDYLEKANILIILGLAIQNMGNYQEAIPVFKEASIFGLKADNRYLFIYASSCQVFALKTVGKLHEAAELCRELEDLAAESGEDYLVLAIALAAKGETLRLWNELGDSLKYAQQAVALAEKWKQADTLHFTLSVLADAYLVLGRYHEARDIIQKSKWIASRVSDWFMSITELQEAKLNLAHENWDQFLQWKKSRCTPKTMSMTYYPVLARYWMIQKDYHEALKVLDEGIARLQVIGAWGRTIELHLMKAVSFSELGKKEKALASLRTSLKMAEPEGYVYLFVIQGKPLMGLLRQVIKKGSQREFARRILSIMEAEESRERPAGKNKTGKLDLGAELPESLSERELEVLRLLNSKLSVPEIAEELTVSPSTVRTHVRVIYSKLGVHGRLEAIQKARELGLI